MIDEPCDESEQFTCTKKWYTSKTIIGAIVSGVSSFALIFGHAVTPELQVFLVDAFCGLGGLVGAGLSAWGRVGATTKIGA